MELQRASAALNDSNIRLSQSLADQQQRRPSQMQQQLQMMTMQQNNNVMNMNNDFPPGTMDNMNASMTGNEIESSIKNQQGQSAQSSSTFSRSSSSNSTGIQNFYNPKRKRKTIEVSVEVSREKMANDKSGPMPSQTLPPNLDVTAPRASLQLDSRVNVETSPLTARLLKEKVDDVKGSKTKKIKDNSSQAKSSAGTKSSHEHDVNPPPVMTNEQMLQLAIKLPVEERVVFASRQVLGAGKNAFSRVTSSMQRMKRQRTRQLGPAGGEEMDDEQLKLKTFNPRFAKKLHSDMIQGLQFTNMIGEVLKSVMREIDPENPLLSIPFPSVFDPETYHERLADETNASSSKDIPPSEKVKSHPPTSAQAARANGLGSKAVAETVAEGMY
jgi:hypothetical protein